MSGPPIIPPPELVEQWETDWRCSSNTDGNRFTSFVATRAAQWGSDQELKACREWISKQDWTWTSAQLYAARRPKPPSLKDQALKALDDAPGPDYPRVMTVLDADQHALIRQALEELPDE